MTRCSDLAAAAALAFVASLALARESRAEEPTAAPRTSSLSWVRLAGADECVSTQALARAVEERLQRKVFVSASQADVSVEARVERRPSGFHAAVVLRDAAGESLGTRELDHPGPTCDGLTEPLAIVVAVMIDPDAQAGPEVNVEAPALATKPDPPPRDRAEPAAPPPSPRRREPFALEGDTSVALAFGLMPRAAAGLAVHGLLVAPEVPVAYKGTIAGFGEQTISSERGARVRVLSAIVDGALCPALRRRAGALYACAGLQVGALSARNDAPEGSTERVDDGLRLLASFTLGARGTLRIAGPFGGQLGAQAVLPVLRPSIAHDTGRGAGEELFRVAPVAAVVDAGLVLMVP